MGQQRAGHPFGPRERVPARPKVQGTVTAPDGEESPSRGEERGRNEDAGRGGGGSPGPKEERVREEEEWTGGMESRHRTSRLRGMRTAWLRSSRVRERHHARMGDALLSECSRKNCDLASLEYYLHGNG